MYSCVLLLFGRRAVYYCRYLWVLRFHTSVLLIPVSSVYPTTAAIALGNTSATATSAIMRRQTAALRWFGLQYGLSVPELVGNNAGQLCACVHDVRLVHSGAAKLRLLQLLADSELCRPAMPALSCRGSGSVISASTVTAALSSLIIFLCAHRRWKIFSARETHPCALQAFVISKT